ncbi:skin secretory protein xP2-like, partial [Aricia agestis]|uniref:skin secretory protein xP2-like n=1 Tax=Aricia agestis TaxID=91739 RepID=UPI001C2076A2
AAPPAVAAAVAAPAAATDADPDHDDDAAADTCRRLAESTPDLLLDTPARAADHFAQDRDTLRRAPPPAAIAAPAAPAPAQHHRQTSSDGGVARTEPGAGAGGALGSPVPARNTLRVAAKFADLTLTGGSLKPALAAKPALLRRPTPHPAHAAPAPASAPASAPAPAEPQ